MHKTRHLTKNAVVLAPVFMVAAATASRPADAQPGLTIYNQNFAVVRQSLPLDLKTGENTIDVNDITSTLEPDSVILRDPSGKRDLQILEQNFRADLVSQEKLLSLYEGKILDFEVGAGDQKKIVKGKIIRSGYNAPPLGYRWNGSGYYSSNGSYYQANSTPIIQVDGVLRFGLPGTPLFPSLTDDTILKPLLHWVVRTNQAGPLNAEFAYVAGGMNWEADYNVVSPETGDTVDVTGWITINNMSGRAFENAKIKLMAGDVSKMTQGAAGAARYAMSELRAVGYPSQPNVTEKAFDEYHLYTLERPSTLRDKETKQVEFIHAAGVKSQRVYVYDGSQNDGRWQGYDEYNYRNQKEYGTKSNPKVWVMREIKNSKENGLGLPLPKGRVRFYRRDSSAAGAAGTLEFTGENVIDHTPTDETIRIYTGNAFDVVGERRQTDFKLDPGQNKWVDETFEIKLRNRKKEPVEVRVVEHLYRGANWSITAKSDAFVKTDARTVEFRVPVKPDEEKVVTYTVHYSW